MGDPLDVLDTMRSPAAEADELRQRVTVLERELTLKDERVKSLESDLRVARYTIRHMEEEAAANLKFSMETKDSKKDNKEKKAGKKKSKTKRRRKKASKGSEGSDDVMQQANHKQGDHLEGEEITYELIAQHYPEMKLATVLRAEQVFQEADIDGNGIIDVTELDKWLTKQDLIFSVNQVTSLLLEMDINKDDSIDFLEYVGIIHDLEDPERFKQKQETLAPTTSAALSSIRTTLHGGRLGSRSSSNNSSGVCSIQ